MNIHRIFATGLICALASFGQISTLTSMGATGSSGSARFSLMQFRPEAVTGAPYSAEQVSESVQVLADGTRITRSIPGMKTFRDSAGRMRSERPMFSGPPGATPASSNAPNIVEIVDPVAGYRYILDLTARVAHRQTLPPATPRTAPPAPAPAGGTASEPPPPPPPPSPPGARPAAPGQPQITSEKLGTQLIEGVLAEGRRSTMTWAVGAFGNDRPITSTSESWFSTELRLTVLHKSQDPRSGESTMRVINLSRAEPDPSLFQPPANFEIVEAKDDITIRWGNPR